LAEKSESLSININTEFQLFINQRIILIEKIMNFLKDDKKSILKIYGSDGIGKSVTFLYFTTIETKYQIIYLNIKDIFKYKSDSYRYFKNALMKYYSSNNFFLNKDKDDDFDKYSNLNYNIYLQAVQDLEK
jgi:pantothenate kinase-related protein Tda10